MKSKNDMNFKLNILAVQENKMLVKQHLKGTWKMGLTLHINGNQMFNDLKYI